MNAQALRHPHALSMKQLSLLCLALASLSLLPGCSSLVKPKSQAPTPMVSRLEPGQSLELRYQSFGCFHSFDYDLSITPDGQAYRVTGTDRSASRTIQDTKVVHNKKLLIPVTLTQQDAVKLDRLFEFYRNITSGDCTTSDTIDVETKAGTRTISKESFKDDTCDTYDRPELLTLAALVRRMKPEENRR